MFDESQIEAASRSLREHWRAGTKLAALETSHRPRDRREAYAEHHPRLLEAVLSPRPGWCPGCGSS